MLTNDDYFKLLGISLPDNCDHYLFNLDIQGSIKTITISTLPIPKFCLHCNSPMHSKGIYIRTVNIPFFKMGHKFI